LEKAFILPLIAKLKYYITFNFIIAKTKFLKVINYAVN